MLKCSSNQMKSMSYQSFSGTMPVGTHHPHQSNTNTPHAQSVTLTYTNSTACLSTQDQSTATATATATNSSARLRHIHIANTPCHHVTRMLRLFCVNSIHGLAISLRGHKACSYTLSTQIQYTTIAIRYPNLQRPKRERGI